MTIFCGGSRLIRSRAQLNCLSWFACRREGVCSDMDQSVFVSGLQCRSHPQSLPKLGPQVVTDY